MPEIEYMDLVQYPYVSADLVSESATCVCCRHRAWRHLLVTSGSRHNLGGNFCWLCGRKFLSMLRGIDEYRPVPRVPSQRVRTGSYVS